MFQIDYQDLCPGTPKGGKIGIVPWDSETFGFPVAEYRPDEEQGSDSFLSHKDLRAALEAWTSARAVELVAVTVPAGNTRALCRLQESGFRYNDTRITIFYPHVQKVKLPPKRFSMEYAQPADADQILTIAETVFDAGRYHADPRFPKELANRRYRDWLRRAMAGENFQRVLVARGEEGEIRGISIAMEKGDRGDPILMAVAPHLVGTTFGIRLGVATYHYFQEQGVKIGYSKISVTNTGAHNLHSYLGAHFIDPEVLLHWHAPSAPHLLDLP